MITKLLKSCSKFLFWLAAFLILLTIVVGMIMGLLTGVASAQEMPDNPLNNEPADPTEECKVIDGNLYLCDKELDTETDTAVLTFYAEEDTKIKLGDAGVFLAGGKMNIEQFELNADRKETIEFDVTVDDSGDSGVSISTPRGQFGEPLDGGWWTPSLPGAPSSADWAAATIAALTTGTGIVAGCTWWFRKRNGGTVDVF